VTVMTTPFQNGDRLGCGEEGSGLGPAVVEAGVRAVTQRLHSVCYLIEDGRKPGL